MTAQTAEDLERVLTALDWRLLRMERARLAAGEAVQLGAGASWLGFVASGKVTAHHAGASAAHAIGGGGALFTPGRTRASLRAETPTEVVLGRLRPTTDAGAAMALLPDLLTVTDFAEVEPAVAALARGMGCPDDAPERPSGSRVCGLMATTVVLTAIRRWAEAGCAPAGWPAVDAGWPTADAGRPAVDAGWIPLAGTSPAGHAGRAPSTDAGRIPTTADSAAGQAPADAGWIRVAGAGHVPTAGAERIPTTAATAGTGWIPTGAAPAAGVERTAPAADRTAATDTGRPLAGTEWIPAAEVEDPGGSGVVPAAGTTAGTDDRPGSAADPFLARVLDAIHADPGRSWTVRRLAAVGAMSRSAFAERFRSATGRTPAAYLTAVRIDAAKALLANGMSVSEASRRLGYASDEGFSRAFRRHAGVTPSSWRVRRPTPEPTPA